MKILSKFQRVKISLGLTVENIFTHFRVNFWIFQLDQSWWGLEMNTLQSNKDWSWLCVISNQRGFRYYIAALWSNHDCKLGSRGDAISLGARSWGARVWRISCWLHSAYSILELVWRTCTCMLNRRTNSSCNDGRGITPNTFVPQRDRWSNDIRLGGWALLSQSNFKDKLDHSKTKMRPALMTYLREKYM